MSAYLAQVYKQKYHLSCSEAAISEQLLQKRDYHEIEKIQRFIVAALLRVFCCTGTKIRQNRPQRNNHKWRKNQQTHEI